VLPRCPDGYSQGISPEAGYRYVDFCIRDLARKFDELGTRRSEVQVKVFGGADVLLGNKSASTRDTVGSINCETALETLAAEGFQIASSSLRGISGLNIRFNTGSGEVELRRLKNDPEHTSRRRGAEGKRA
jgi:chemotaxis receptor (MCP) glutamine deamidase CheD